MSRSATRARHRRAQIESLLDRVQNAKSTMERSTATGELVRLFQQIARSGTRLWSVERLVVPPRRGTRGEDADETRALIAHIVAPHLAGQGTRRRSPGCD